MLVFGTKHKTTKRGGGRFFCPQCQRERKYTKYRVAKKGHVFFVSVMDRGTVAEYIQCNKCGGQFDAAVLAAPSGKDIKADLVMAYRGCLAVIAGCDRNPTDEEIAVARRLNEEFSGSHMPEDMQQRDVAKANVNNLISMLAHYADVLPDEAKAGILQDCLEVATADGDVSKVEQHHLGLIGRALGVPRAYIDAMIQASIS
jgi:uncharacterized tellurite resistance protein B-like protein